jgi:hypothetical protein
MYCNQLAWIEFIVFQHGSHLLVSPRVYPQGFADEILRLYPGLITGAEGFPEVNRDVSPQQIFEATPWATWPEANLIQCVRYFRGNRHLEVPADWLQVFPAPFEVLHRMEQRSQSNENLGR